MKINFYLKDKKSDGKTPILLSFSYNGNRLKYSTGISIHPKSWSNKSGKIYSGVSGSVGMNAILKKMEFELSNIYHKIIHDDDNIPAPDFFKEYLNNKFKNTTQTDSKTFFEYFDEFVESKYKTGAEIRKYNSLRNHLKNIEKKLKIKLSYNTFSRKFHQTFIDFFVEIGQTNQTIKDKHLKAIKTFLNWSVFNEYTPTNNFSGIKFPYQVSESYEIALNEKDIKNLYNLDLSEKIRLQNVRDVFLLECYTGVRFSDLKKITADNIKGNELHIYTEKTRENNVVIPLRPEALEIINKYHLKGLEIPIKTNQKTNEYIKEIGKLAGMDDTVSWVVLSGRNKTVYKEKRYNKLKTHTGRRTFITTNIERGLTPLQIMSITTHKTYSEFQKYYKPERINIKQQYLTAWSQSMIQVN